MTSEGTFLKNFSLDITHETDAVGKNPQRREGANFVEPSTRKLNSAK